ncbi:MAG: type II toxin-antitoxin system RelE/ParE family toxin [Hyphomicrobiales bacterium]|nr:type II toxin-antitoxin system RelE/ParE family toxin [Hyphomicrobiales bacterium]
MIVVLTAEAEADLEWIGDHIARDNPARAMTFIRELRGCCEYLADFPKAYPLVPRFEHTGVRRQVHGSYLIFYRLAENAIEVIHILHGSRDYEPLLFPQE